MLNSPNKITLKLPFKISYASLLFIIITLYYTNKLQEQEYNFNYLIFQYSNLCTMCYIKHES